MKQITLAITFVLTASTAAFSQNTHTVIKQGLDSVVRTNFDKYFFSYDNKGNYIQYSWNRAWVKYSKSEFLYDSNVNLVVSYDFYRWSEENNTWEKWMKDEYIYDKKGNQTSTIFYDWENNTWKKYDKHVYTYDDKGNQTLEIRYMWQKEKEYEKYERAYDNNNNQIVEIYYEKYEENDWKLRGKTEYIFDLSYSKTDLIIPTEREYIGTNMLTKEIYYTWSGTDWIEKKVTTYHWSAKEIIVEN